MTTKKTILVVEDDRITREGLNVVLRRAGYEVILAANGEEALSSLDRQYPDLILLDMLMPVLDGYHLLEMLKILERLKTETPLLHIPIVVVTASTVLTREWAVDKGCCGLVHKPIDIEKMLEEIRRCLPPSEPDAL